VRVALVTGAARGIGRACAARLARDGFRVLIADQAGADEAAADIEGAQPHTVDLADAAQTRALAAAVLVDPGRCDVLVNNAAHLGRHVFEELDLDIWRRFHAVNVEAPFLLCSTLVPAMAQRGGGRVVNIVSNTVWAPPPAGLCAYVTTKSALLGFTRALAVEFGGRGVTVNAVAPGLTPTPGSRADMGPDDFAHVREQQSIGRSLMPEDVAGAVSYLVSDDAAAVTGQALRVDGGLVTL
jgi:NAD(P)-dependent dehydrogenase (short-subunit alcohol dehydrogenase family)